jgi:tRNA G18 (ribose-2'-O)-methylase SpoU
MKYLAQQKRAYHLVDDTELGKVAGSQHHGGIVLLVKRKPVTSLALYLQQKRKQNCLLALDGVGNPHKMGNTIPDFPIWTESEMPTKELDKCMIFFNLARVPI